MSRPLNIAHVTSTFPPYWAGTGNVAFHNARVLHDRGHRVTVFTATPADGGAYATPYRTERLPPLFRMGNAPFTPHLLSRLRGFDAIHVHYPYIFGAELALAASKLFRIPLILTYHNRLQEETILKRSLFAAYNTLNEPVLLRAAVRLLAVSRDHLLTLHPGLSGSERVVEIPNGVDTDAFKPIVPETGDHPAATPPAGPVALFVGSLDQAHRFKNVAGLIRAFARVSVPDATLWIIGDGDLRPDLETLTGSLGLGSRVRFMGAHPPDSLPPIFSAATVTVLPSIGVESFGIVLIESMACGTPVIASALPGVRTLVDAGRDGMLVPPGDIDSLAKALDTMLADPGRAADMGGRGREKMVRRYDWRSIGLRLETIYQEVSQHRHAPEHPSTA